MMRVSENERVELEKKLDYVKRNRQKLERRKGASSLERNLGYPLAMLVILALTGLALLLVRVY